MANRITICVDVDLNDIATSKLESLLLETMSGLLDGDVYSEYVLNLDSCIDEVKEERS
jgi:hypothetical protein